jgi:ABC-2 type transport system ATP-binding protein
VLKYIKEIGKDRTILLSTHNLAEVEEACARAIIVSKGRVVADGPLDEIRAKTGRVRYVVAIDEKNGEAGSKAPGAKEVDEALHKLSGATAIRELPTDENAHKFELSGPTNADLRAEIFRLMVAKNWTLLELRRDAQSLDAVFRDLTRGDERLDRGADWEDEEEEDEDEEPRKGTKAGAAAAASTADDDDDDDDDDNDDDDDDDDDDADDEAGREKPQGKG